MRDISRRLRGDDLRKAIEAVDALRGMDRDEAMRQIPVIDTADEQRALQLMTARIVAESGVRGLAVHWKEVSRPEWRGMLVEEVGSRLDARTDEGNVELLLQAIEDPAPAVERGAMRALKEWLRILPARERKQEAKSERGKIALEARDRVRTWMTPARLARIAAAVTAALERCRENPHELHSPDGYIELLGLIATRRDARALAVLEALRPKAGEPYRTEFEKLDRDNLPFPTSEVADKKGVPPGTPMMRVKSIHTGLLDLANLEEAIARIKGRD